MEQQDFLPVSATKEPFNLIDFLQFKRMVTLQVIPILYAIVAVIITLGGIALMFSGGNSRGFGDSLMPQGGFFSGLIFLVIGNILWRMWCEFILVLFRVNKNLQDIERNTRPPRP